MKIAIASCANARIYKSQPVWRNVGKLSPQALVLLGDAIYLDVPWADVDMETLHPNSLLPQQFLRHGLELYRKQLNVPSFSKLLRSLEQAYAIWDDHDFLWNDADGDAISKNIYGGHIRASRALAKVFREALAARNPALLPVDETDVRLSTQYEPAPGYQLVQLNDDVCLHLTDGRSFRNKNDLLSSGQRGLITSELERRPNQVHLLASGCVYRGNRNSWEAFPDDDHWLSAMADAYKIIIMSGDVHYNSIGERLTRVDGCGLYEITSSGAAIGKWVSAGPKLHNFGLVEIADNRVKLSTYSDDPANEDHSLTLDIPTWRPV